MDPEVETYFKIRLSQKTDQLVLEGQSTIQKLESDAARSGMSRTGAFEFGLLGVYCDWNVTRPTLALLECFEAACAALKVDPQESDYDEIQQLAEALLDKREEGARRFASDRAARRGIPTDYASPVQQSAGRTRSELRRTVELRKIEARKRSRRLVPELRDEVFRRIGEVNSQSKRVLGYALFVTTEHAVVADLGRVPSSSEELTACVQALGILLTQVDHERLRSELSAANIDVPEGSMNHLLAVLNLRRIAVEPAVQRLRDLGRLRNLYPAHPDHPDILAAVERLGIPRQPTNTVETWERILRILSSALDELRVALAGVK